MGNPPLPGGLARYLATCLGQGDGQSVRVIRVRGRNAIVEISHLHLPAARSRWGEAVSVRTHRTWGTLKRAKIWLASQEGERPHITR